MCVLCQYVLSCLFLFSLFIVSFLVSFRLSSQIYFLPHLMSPPLVSGSFSVFILPCSLLNLLAPYLSPSPCLSPSLSLLLASLFHPLMSEVVVVSGAAVLLFVAVLSTVIVIYGLILMRKRRNKKMKMDEVEIEAFNNSISHFKDIFQVCSVLFAMAHFCVIA